MSEFLHFSKEVRNFPEAAPSAGLVQTGRIGPFRNNISRAQGSAIAFAGNQANFSAMKANLYAPLATIVWASLAALGVLSEHVPPFLLTGISLGVGSVLAWPFVFKDRRQWLVAPGTLFLGVSSLFGYHFLLFIALRVAPAVEVNLINYLWPLLIVVLAPLYVPGLRLRVAFRGGGAGICRCCAGHLGRTCVNRCQRQPDFIGRWMGLFVGAGRSDCLGQLFAANQARCVKQQGIFHHCIGLFGLLAGLLSLVCGC